MLNSVLLLGLGGTGSMLVEPLSRLLSSKNCSLTICDGDSYSPTNRERQIYCQEFNKAIATKMDLRRKGLIVKAIPSYMTTANAKEILESLEDFSCVITAVDRDITRRLSLEILREVKEDFLWISPGNDYSQGCVQSVLRKGGIEDGGDPLSSFENLRNPKDNHPNEDCLTLSESSPQLITANMGAAWITLSIIQNYLLLKEKYKSPKEVWYDTEKMRLSVFHD